MPARSTTEDRQGASRSDDRPLISLVVSQTTTRSHTCEGVEEPKAKGPRSPSQTVQRAGPQPHLLRVRLMGLWPPHAGSRILSGVRQCLKRLPGWSWHVSRDARILSSRSAVSALRSFEAVTALQQKSHNRMHAVSRLTSHDLPGAIQSGLR